MGKILSGREAYRQELSSLAKNDPKIVCLETDLAGYKNPFAEAHPDRFFNLGIGELAAVDIAAGMAKNGFVPFYSTFARFAALRAAESMKIYQGYMGLNINIVCPYAGVAGAFFGATHQCLEDLAIAQSISGLKIVAPYGEDETRDAIKICAEDPSPYYIRLGRSGRFKTLTQEDNRFESLGVVGHKLGRGNICLISVGEQGTHLCADLVENDVLSIDHIHLKYLDIHQLKLAIGPIASAYQELIVVEEARPQGSVASTIALNFGRDVRVSGFNCGDGWLHTGGSHEDCLEKLGFTTNRLREIVKWRLNL